jgi:hypothetical protein
MYKKDNEATLMLKMENLLMLLHGNLQHFPAHEKFNLTQEIRRLQYEVLIGIVECEKKYHNTTSLTKLDIAHEQLRTLVNLAYKFHYFEFHNGKRERSISDALHKYTSVSSLINEVGAIIGAWIKKTHTENDAKKSKK